MTRILRLSLLALFLCAALLGPVGCGQQPPPEKPKLNLYVAAGLKKPMDAVIAAFQKDQGAAVTVNYGPSGGLYTQIKEGQPCDLYFSADWLYIEKLQKDQKLVEGHKFLKDNIVLIVSPKGEAKVKSVNDLANKGVTLVLADPQAPVGVYAETALKKLGLWEKVNAAGTLKARPSTVNQVAIMVKEDQVDAGLIYSSVAGGFDLKIAQILPEDLTGEIVFAAGVIKGGNEKLAQEFYTYARQHVTEFTNYGWRWQAYE